MFTSAAEGARSVVKQGLESSIVLHREKNNNFSGFISKCESKSLGEMFIKSHCFVILFPLYRKQELTDILLCHMHI